MKADDLVAQIVPREVSKPATGRLARLGALALAMALLAIAWRWTPLRDWLNLQSLVAFAETLDDLPFTPLAVLGAYVIAGLLIVPIMILIAVTGIVFGPFWGILYAATDDLTAPILSHLAWDLMVLFVVPVV